MRFLVLLIGFFSYFFCSLSSGYAQCTTVFDETPPAIPILDSISINPLNGSVFLAWQASTSLDTKGYVVYQLNNGVWLSVATINGINSTTYTYSTSSVTEGLDFRIAAFDSCTNISPQGTVHKTIFINVQQDRCAKTNKLTWNAYQGWSNISSYAIYVSINGGVQKLIGNTSGSTNVFIHKKIEPFTTYCYYVRAIDATQTKSSLSHQLCFTANVYKVPDYLYLVTASVENEMVKLIAYADKTADLKHYLVLRATDVDANYKTIDTLKPSFTNNEINFIDSTAEVNKHAYYYKLLAVDSCSLNIKTSENNVCSILLNAESSFGLLNTLTWNAFKIWNAGTKNYQMYRGEEPDLLMSFAYSDTTNYNDDIKNYIIQSGKYCYQVEAMEADTNKYKYKATSKSNIFCVVQEPTIYIPNAFNPGGDFNKIFMPKGMFFDNEKYSIEIFNRFGQKVFESIDPTIGWDGSDAPLGIYVYKIRYGNPDNKLIILDGVLTLIR